MKLNIFITLTTLALSGPALGAATCTPTPEELQKMTAPLVALSGSVVRTPSPRALFESCDAPEAIAHQQQAAEKYALTLSPVPDLVEDTALEKLGFSRERAFTLGTELLSNISYAQYVLEVCMHSCKKRLDASKERDQLTADAPNKTGAELYKLKIKLLVIIDTIWALNNREYIYCANYLKARKKICTLFPVIPCLAVSQVQQVRNIFKKMMEDYKNYEAVA